MSDRTGVVQARSVVADLRGRVSRLVESGSMFDRGSRLWLRSSSRVEQVLREGRENDVRPSLYKGRECGEFDAPALFCYLLAHRDGQPCGGIDGVCDLFEARVGELPASGRRRLQGRFAGMAISAAPDGDDMKHLAAVTTFVDEVAGWGVALGEL
jgi:hypothetical protein